MLYHGTVPMKAENAVLILYTQRQHRGTAVEMFTALWHLIMTSADGGGSENETPYIGRSHSNIHMCIRVEWEKLTCVFIVIIKHVSYE